MTVFVTDVMQVTEWESVPTGAPVPGEEGPAIWGGGRFPGLDFYEEGYKGAAPTMLPSAPTPAPAPAPGNGYGY
jgi:hypothetical protein